MIRLQRKVMELENKVQLMEESAKLGNGVVSRRDLLGGGGRPRSEFLPRAPPQYALTGHRSPITVRIALLYCDHLLLLCL